jgi:hypothetical protein
MYKRLTQLSFVIGLFFTIVSLILFVNMIINNAFSGLNIYTTIAFFIFGLGMIAIEPKGEK